MEFDGYYLESDPCLVCNNPEVPFCVSIISRVHFRTLLSIPRQLGVHWERFNLWRSWCDGVPFVVLGMGPKFWYSPGLKEATLMPFVAGTHGL